MKHTALLSLALTSMLGLAGFSTNAVAKQYYKWVDANGSTHYTTTPPPRNAKKQGSVNTYGWANSSPTPSRVANTQTNQNTNNQTQEATTNQQQPTQNTDTNSSAPSTNAGAEL